jgi:hypothetical protein
MLVDDKFYDVIFMVGDISFKAHKIILSIRSESFAEMF